MVCVIGEALIDLVLESSTAGSGSLAYLAHPGGSPYNVAIGLARLGGPSQLLARLSGDAFGRQLRSHAQANQVDLSLAVAAPEASTLAVVSLDADRNATYDFYRTGTADWQWTAAELARIPADAGWVHTGSLASWTSPGAEVIEARLAELAGTAVISFDPNIRPALLTDHAEAVARIERLVSLATVVKASAEDLHGLYPELGVPQVLARWRDRGPALVVVTDGGRGAQAIADGDPFTVAARPITVVDTVGAGDAFMAGLINALARDELVTRGLQTGDRLAAEQVRPAIEEAILVAALTCTRAGADPPTAAELAAAQG
ncbi:MAG: carbohydrate kinase [Actinomycetota bacterium]|nr:carbohydrate kinase [Actinomycetota bacterium]MDQ2958767.1 carbohydrate kinase [Actinomycetota bacterium]